MLMESLDVARCECQCILGKKRGDPSWWYGVAFPSAIKDREKRKRKRRVGEGGRGKRGGVWEQGSGWPRLISCSREIKEQEQA